VPANATPVSLESGALGDPHRLLTGPVKASGPTVDPSAAQVLAGRLKLLGVVAPRHEGEAGGVALISIDGKPPKAFRTGGTIEGDLTLQALTQRGATIGPANGPAAVTLDLPLLPPPATGALPPPTGVSTSDGGGAPAGGQPPSATPGGFGGPPGMGGTGAGAPGVPGAMGGSFGERGMPPEGMQGGRPIGPH
jgi:general secretion pathway protein C